MQTKLIYTVIVRKRKTVLCEFTESSGNFSQIVKKVLEKLNKIELIQFKVAFILENYMFYCLLIDNIYIIAMTTVVPLTSNINEILFGFLYNIHSTVISTVEGNKLKKAPAFSLGELVNMLRDNMKLFDKNPEEHFSAFVDKVSNIPFEESLNNQLFDTGNPFAILTKSQIHEEQPNELEKSESSILHLSNYKDMEKTFLKEELYFDEGEESKTQGYYKNKWFYITIIAVIVIIALIFIIAFVL